MPTAAKLSETSAIDLRSLFRDSEARAARLKLLIQVSRDLAAAEGRDLDTAVARAAQRAAVFAGYGRGAVLGPADDARHGAQTIALEALAERGHPGRRLEFWNPLNPDAIASEDDAEALRLLVELIEARLVVDAQGRVEADLLGRLERREKELEQVLSSLVTAQERERSLISADLHDGVAQEVAALHRRLELLRLDLADSGSPAAKAHVDALIDMARTAVSDLRSVISGMRPTSLDDLGVVAALREEARRLEVRGHDVRISERGLGRLPDWLETLVFRLGQEALNNVAKHAPGASVRMDLSIDAASRALTLTVQNVGGDRAANGTDEQPRFGLEIMRERVAAVSGTLETVSLSNGFRVRAVIPLDRG
jgi:two-component system, NarL family, sensor kinase